MLADTELPEKERFGIKPLPNFVAGRDEEETKRDTVCPDIVLAIMAAAITFYEQKIQGDPMEVRACLV